jgi:hypothetical protein
MRLKHPILTYHVNINLFSSCAVVEYRKFLPGCVVSYPRRQYSVWIIRFLSFLVTQSVFLCLFLRPVDYCQREQMNLPSTSVFIQDHQSTYSSYTQLDHNMFWSFCQRRIVVKLNQMSEPFLYVSLVSHLETPWKTWLAIPSTSHRK